MPNLAFTRYFAPLLALAASACTVETERRPYVELPPVGSVEALQLAAPAWDDAFTGYRCLADGCAARFALLLTTEGVEPRVRVTLANLDSGVEDSLELPLSVLGEREIRFTGLPAGTYEPFVTVLDEDRVMLTEHGIDRVRAILEYDWSQGAR